MNNKKQGFTIIELMISMLIGLFLLATMITLYLSNKRSYQEQQQFNMLEDSGRNALYELTDIIQHTGYRTKDLHPLNSNFITGSVTAASCTTGTNISDTSIINATSDASSDVIGVTYYADSNLNRDCSGTTLPSRCALGNAPDPAAAIIYNSFNIDSSGTIPELKCSSSLSSTAITLVKGIENIQVNYGVDQNGDNRVDNYMNAAMVSTESAWNQVISVQVAVLARTLKEVNETAKAQSYVLLDKKIDIRADKYHRAVFSTLIRLPNTKS
jgi:type IV pilus assembly protein PilW